MFECGHGVIRKKSIGTPERIRTSGLWYRKPTLYPAELRVHMVPRVGLEPTTLGLEVLCSIQLSYRGVLLIISENKRTP